MPAIPMRALAALLLVQPLLHALPSGATLPVEVHEIGAEGSPAPGLPGVVLDHLSEVPLVDDAGRVAFGAVLSGPPHRAIFVASPSGVVTPVWLQSDAVVGLGVGESLDTLKLLAFAGGEILASADIVGPAVDPLHDFVLVRKRLGEAPEVVTDAFADGVPANAYIDRISDAQLAAGGHVAFKATLGGAVQGFAGLSAFGPDGAGGVTLKIRQTQLPPDPDLGFGSVSMLGRSIRVNRAGDVAMRATYSALGVSTPVVVGPHPDAPFRRVVVRGQDAVGAQVPSTLVGLGDELSLSDAGDVTFFGRCENGEGLWQQTFAGPLVPRMVACPTQPVPDLPGVPAGLTFESISSYFAASEDGSVGFLADLHLPRVGPQSAWRVAPGDAGPGQLLAIGGGRIPQLRHLIRYVRFIDLDRDGNALVHGFTIAPQNQNHAFLLYAPAGGDPVTVLEESETIRIRGRPTHVRNIQFAQDRHEGRRSFRNGLLAVRVLRDGGESVYRIGTPALPATDGDLIPASQDNCPDDFNPNQFDTDGDGVGDVCNDADDPDGDEFADVLDNCPDDFNPGQLDTDADGVGDVCNDADDRDGDEFADALDNCPDTPNPTLADLDGDGLGDACDPFPDEVDHEKGQLRVDLSDAQDALLVCLDRPLFEDADGDGEFDGTDACPGTEPDAEVDAAGCSQTQFCASRMTEGRGWIAAVRCWRADWRADEPLRVFPRDCRFGAEAASRHVQCLAVDPPVERPERAKLRRTRR